MQICSFFFTIFLSSVPYAQSDSIYIDGIKVIPNDSVKVTSEKFGFDDNGPCFSIVDTNYTYYSLPKHFLKPKNWMRADSVNINGGYYGDSYPENWTLSDVLAIIDTAKTWSKIRTAKSWCLKNYEASFPHLIARLGIKEKIGLINTADLLIWDRIRTGDLTFYGHGSGMTEDIFTIAGRASWILNELTGERFAQVRVTTTEEDVQEFKKQWVSYLNKLADK